MYSLAFKVSEEAVMSSAKKEKQKEKSDVSIPMFSGDVEMIVHAPSLQMVLIFFVYICIDTSNTLTS